MITFTNINKKHIIFTYNNTDLSNIYGGMIIQVICQQLPSLFAHTNFYWYCKFVQLHY